MRIGHVDDYPILGEKGAEFFGSVQSHLEKEEKKIGTSGAELGKITTEFFAAHGDKDSTYERGPTAGQNIVRSTNPYYIPCKFTNL